MQQPDDQNKLEKLREEIGDCKRCTLSASRTNIVIGDGDEGARVMFVGEAPGFHEDVQGLPFVGSAGKLLSQFLGEIGLRRSDVYITNIVKCRPPDNRDPLSEEIETCRQFLSRQIDIIKPDVICTLGNHATRTLLGRSVSITRIRGQVQEAEGCFIFPMLHPAAALHKGNMMDKVREDFQNLRKFLDRGIKPEPAQKQLELF
ncbi:MAG: uracil-DNA glycosylase family protein [Candidatus Glassbacteria bacterium]